MRSASTRESTGTGLLAGVPLSPNELRAAEQYLALGERLAECILRVAAVVSSAMHAIERFARTLAGKRSTG